MDLADLLIEKDTDQPHDHELDVVVDVTESEVRRQQAKTAKRRYGGRKS